MGSNEQQNETLKFFRGDAAHWNAKAGTKGGTDVDVIGQRIDCVLRAAERHGGVRNALDMGCGTGQLSIALARRGVVATGIDFAQEMIALAQRTVQSEGIETCQFLCGSIFDVDPDQEVYDLISALGLIEYVSSEELDRLLDRIRAIARPGASVVIGSRNRLFNLFSLNDYTRAEAALGTIDALQDEAIRIAQATDIDSCLAELRSLDPALPPFEQHGDTGIDVSVRHQYTPAELVDRLERCGLTATALSPVHYHGMTPQMKSVYPAAHKEISEGIQPAILDAPWAVPMASTFMIEAQA